MEFQGDGMVCLNSKVYTIWTGEKSKTSCKGTQQKRNDLLKKRLFISPSYPDISPCRERWFHQRKWIDKNIHSKQSRYGLFLQ